MSHPRQRHSCRPRVAIAVSLVLALLCVSPPALCESRADKNQDIVFLVDISSSMRDIFGDVRNAIYDYVLHVRPGDNVVIVAFGETVSLRIRQRISSDEDVKLIKRELANLDPDEYYTNITGALDKGLEELQRLGEYYPDHLKTVVLFSDGKNNPPERGAQPLTFEEIFREYEDILTPEKGGFGFFYLSLGEDPDPQVITFMEDVDGLSFDIGKETPALPEQKEPLTLAQVFVEPTSIDLGMVPGPSALITVSLAFFPARGNPAGNIITTGMSAYFRDNPSWKTIVEVKPPQLSCSQQQWSTTLLFNIESFEEGTIVGTLELKPRHGQILFIEPSEIPVTLTIRQPRVQVRHQGKLTFGPLGSRTDYSQTKTILLIPNEAAIAKDLQVIPDIELPDGISLEADIQGEGKRRTLAVTVTATERFAPADGTPIEGAIQLSGAHETIAFSPNRLDVVIKVGESAGMGKEIVAAVRNAIIGFFSRFGRWIALGVIIILFVLILRLGYYWWRYLRPRSLLEGNLVLTRRDDKPMETEKPTKLKLNSIGKSLGRDALIIGSSKEAGITLAHKSVASDHCEISAKYEQGNKRIFLEPIRDRLIEINGEHITEATPLSDRDIIKIGAYEFRFENPHPYRQIVVRYLDGRIVKGTPATWDIESEGFGLLPRDALPGSTEEVFIHFDDLKAVYFVRDFDGGIREKRASPKYHFLGTHMILTFHDGEEMEGYTSEVYDARSPRFYFFPADQSANTMSVLVERKHLKNIEVLDTKDIQHPPDEDSF
jgi:hypothetical protein